MKYHALILFAALGIIGCEKEEKENDINLITIELLTSDNPDFFRKTVILFENWNYVVKTNFETYINEYPFVSYMEVYDEIKLEAIADTSELDVLDMVDYLKYAADSTYVLAHHLEGGTCLLYDKKSESIIQTIQMEEYEEGVGLTGSDGRRFYIMGKLFIETVDSVH